MDSKIIRIAIFASGNGSNTENIIRYFGENSSVSVDLIVSNNKNAYVLQRAAKLGIETRVIERADFMYPNEFILFLKERKIDWIILAGFLWLIPADLINTFPKKIVNIHPALLPKYGGKGMYGDFVHRAVSESGDTETGISIHFVNQSYDEGEILFQKIVKIEAYENPEIIAEKIHQLEYSYYPQVIEKIIS